MKILRLSLLVLSMLTSVLTLSAQENYKILFLNTPNIKIGERLCRLGDCFNENEVIVWENEKQAMKVVCTRTNKQNIILAKLNKGKRDRTLSSYLVQNKHLSARVGSPLTVAELKNYLSDTFYLIDSIKIPTSLLINEKKFFYLSYSYEGEVINKKLPSGKGCFIIDKMIYSIDGKLIPPFDTTFSVYYLNEQKGECLPLTTEMRILPVEEWINK